MSTRAAAAGVAAFACPVTPVKPDGIPQITAAEYSVIALGKDDTILVAQPGCVERTATRLPAVLPLPSTSPSMVPVTSGTVPTYCRSAQATSASQALGSRS